MKKDIKTLSFVFLFLNKIFLIQKELIINNYHIAHLSNYVKRNNDQTFKKPWSDSVPKFNVFLFLFLSICKNLRFSS